MNDPKIGHKYKVIRDLTVPRYACDGLCISDTTTTLGEIFELRFKTPGYYILKNINGKDRIYITPRNFLYHFASYKEFSLMNRKLLL